MFEWTGTYDPTALLAVPAAIAFQVHHHWQAMRTACHRLLLEASARIQALTGLLPVSPDSSDGWAGSHAAVATSRLACCSALAW